MISAGLDFSGPEAAFSVCDGGKLLFKGYKPMSGRDASELAIWIKDSLASAGLDFSKVQEWICGTGPGSFTGLRIAAALITGICFERENSKFCGVPTAIAMAMGHNLSQGSKIAAIFDGRKEEILLFEMEVSDSGRILHNGKTDVLQVASADLSAYSFLTAFSRDREALKSLDSRFKINYIEHLDAENLCVASSYSATDIKELIYIRPAVFVPPKEIREI